MNRADRKSGGRPSPFMKPASEPGTSELGASELGASELRALLQIQGPKKEAIAKPLDSGKEFLCMGAHSIYYV